MEPHDGLAARYLPLSAALRGAWDDARCDDASAEARVFFAALARLVRRTLAAGDHAGLPAIFAEVERSLASPRGAEADGARGFLEDLVDGYPEAYVHVLPWLGAGSLQALRAWEAGARDPFLTPSGADARLLAPLSARCPALARAWPRAAPHVAAADGTTTAHGVADLCFEVARAALLADDEDGVRSLFAALEGPLGSPDRALARAFERCALERLRELSLAQVERVRPHLGPRARAYWCACLRLGEPRFGVWEPGPDGPALRRTAVTGRGDAWGWSLVLPRGEAGETVREALIRGGDEIGGDDTVVDGRGDVSASWSWGEDDPPGAYALEVRLGARCLARFEFTLA